MDVHGAFTQSFRSSADAHAPTAIGVVKGQVLIKDEPIAMSLFSSQSPVTCKPEVVHDDDDDDDNDDDDDDAHADQCTPSTDPAAQGQVGGGKATKKGRPRKTARKCADMEHATADAGKHVDREVDKDEDMENEREESAAVGISQEVGDAEPEFGGTVSVWAPRYNVLTKQVRASCFMPLVPSLLVMFNSAGV